VQSLLTVPSYVVQGNKIRVQEGLNSDQLKKVLAGAGAYKVSICRGE
jgi:hypothetical protein